MERAVNKANELASRAESIRKFEIVPDEFTEENGLVTPSMKARRQAVVEHYRTLIDKVLYVPRKPALTPNDVRNMVGAGDNPSDANRPPPYPEESRKNHRPASASEM